MHSHKIRFGFVWAALVLLLGSTAVLRAQPLQDGDRVIFVGDSITEQRIYTRYVMDYFALRFPKLKVTFRNAGVGGDNAAGGLARLQRDVLSEHPTVVTICFGMNDGGYGAFNEKLYANYMASMQGLVSKLKQASVGVVLLTPGCVDGGSYNDTLARFAAGVKELGARENLPVFDIHALMLDVQTRAKQRNPAFTMMLDGVHPNPVGHALMAYGLLSALGCHVLPSGLAVDAAKATVTEDRCVVKDLHISDSMVTFTRTDDALPTYLDRGVSAIVDYAPFLTDLNRYRLQVTRLKSGNWQLKVQGLEVGTFSPAELAAGVDLAGRPGPWQGLVEAVDGFAREQEEVYLLRRAWNNYRPTLPKEADKEKQAMVARLDRVIADAVADKERKRAELVAHRTWKWSLNRVQ
jgi:lysophospholipase L1-like esterase